MASTGALLLLLLFVLACGGNGGAAAAVFSGCSFESQEEAEAFEAALLQQACFNVTAFGGGGGGGGGEGGCVSRLDTARGGAGSGPVPVLRAAVRDTLGEAVGAVAAVAGLASLSNHAREEMAVRDCVELVGYSVDELGWALDAMADPDGGVAAAEEEDETEPETRRRRRRGARAEDDIHAWLSAAMGNQGTCLDGFHGTDSRLLRRVESAVTQLTQLVSNLLAMHKKLRDITPQHQHQHHHHPGNNNNKNGTADGAAAGGDDTGPSSDLPPWVTDVVDDVEEEVTATRGRGRSSSSGRKAMRVDVVVAQDGSGRWRTVSEAVARAPSHSRRRYVIYVKRGVYEENVEVRKKKTNIVIVGEGMGETPEHGRRLDHLPERHAVALRVDSDRSAFFRIAVEGHQDTLYAHSLRQFYRDCRVSGTVDFIFGNGIAVIQRTTISTLPPAAGQNAGSVTAQGRRDPNQNTGFALHACIVEAKYPTYLGRPWKPFSRVVVMESYLGAGVQPRGWLEWDGDGGELATLFYGEYRNYGPGANIGGRVRWPGYHVIMDAAVAVRFTVRRFIDGLAWLPSTGVTFTADLNRK
uniref:Pectinesterase n=1 Tax=Oryza rufipogon TaxID=4529 RepID=A0A0E0MU29_ORYRU